MKTITVITLQNIRNYGSVLQALATQTLFESLGCQVDFINYWRTDTLNLWAKASRLKRNEGFVKKLITAIILAPTHFRQNYVFGKFLRQYLHVQKQKITTTEDFKKIPITSDIYCTGSDQTWNSEWNEGLIPGLFLDFVPDNIKKIAYSSSMGKTKFDTWEKEQTQKLLSRYNFISVREQAAVEAIKDLKLSATHVLDPTLQMTKNYWLSLSSNIKIRREEYILVYQLNKNIEFDKYAEEYARRTGFKLYRLCFNYTQVRQSGNSLLLPRVEDFIAYIANAKCVITDSFHATAFSVNLNTPFISIYPKEFSSRIASLLELTGLTERHLSSYDDFSYIDKKLNFSHANDILESQRQKAIDFLKKAIK